MTGVSIAAMGATAPYLAVTLSRRGLDGVALAVIMAMGPIARLVVGPLWGMAADRYRAEVRVLRAAAVIAAIGAASVAFGTGPVLWLGALLMAIGRVGVSPVLDGATLKALGAQGHRYGWYRAWGSLGYLLMALLAPRLGNDGDQALALGAGLAVVLVIQCFRLPELPSAGPPVRVWPALVDLWADRAFRWLLIASALHFSAHALYDQYFALYMVELGRPVSWTGMAVAVGVGVEVAVMLGARRILTRVPAEALFVGSMVLAVPRWLFTAWLAEPWAIVALQSLHGLTFGAFWVAGVSLVWKRAPRAMQTSAQGLFGAAVGGVGSLLGSQGSLLVEGAGSRVAFAVCAGVAVCAALAGSRAVRPVARDG